MRLAGPTLRLLLHDELIHARECVRILLLVGVPVVEIGAGGIVRELQTISQQHVGIMVKAKQLESVVGEESLDLWEREPMLLDMEQEIAATAGGIEIAARDDCSDR